MDAGTRAEDHYRRHMAPWRFWLRQQMINVVRVETSVLARLQRAVRSPLVDSYFAVTANIGTHTFYMVILPVFFWFNDYAIGSDFVWVLALGVFFTGVIKDLLCLPRPMSPPLHRISMSGSAMLEYGMPSTHTANAVGVAMLAFERNPGSTYVQWGMAWLLCTLILGRLYTGMHGFSDIVAGAGLGFCSNYARVFLRDMFTFQRLTGNLFITVIMILAISACPQPVDNCPCFDDSVSFFGVVLGMIWTRYFVYVPTRIVYNPSKASWMREQIARMRWVPDTFVLPILNRWWKPSSRFERFSQYVLDNIHVHEVKVITGREAVLRGFARFLIGVVFIVVWRHFSKRILLRLLVPVWRMLKRYGVQNPRRNFLDSSQYDSVPPDSVPLDGIPDSKKELQEILARLKKTHGHDDSVGPQSEADLFELKAQVQKQAQILAQRLAKESKERGADKEVSKQEQDKNAAFQLDMKYVESLTIIPPRKYFDIEVIVRLLVYGGIALMTFTTGPIVFNMFNI